MKKAETLRSLSTNGKFQPGIKNFLYLEEPTWLHFIFSQTFYLFFICTIMNTASCLNFVVLIIDVNTLSSAFQSGIFLKKNFFKNGNISYRDLVISCSISFWQKDTQMIL